jgi:hypothetical protein
MAEVEAQVTSVTEDRWRGGWSWLLIFLPVVYILSLGPACLAVKTHILPEDVLCVYFPLQWLDIHVPLARAVFKWYLNLWGFP